MRKGGKEAGWRESAEPWPMVGDAQVSGFGRSLPGAVQGGWTKSRLGNSKELRKGSLLLGMVVHAVRAELGRLRQEEI